MEPASAVPEDDLRWLDAALAAGLRAVDVRRLPYPYPGHTACGRVLVLTLRALSVGRELKAVTCTALHRHRVRALLAKPDGDVALERLQRWVETGVTFHA